MSCLVALNYKDLAIFTFMADGKFNLRSACMPLTQNADGELQAHEMTVCYEEKQEEHKMDRFHMKSACIAKDDSILVVCRGRVPDMREQVALLILRFDVFKKRSGQYILKRNPQILRAFPTIFPRHLENTVRRDEYLLCVQDTEAADDFVINKVELDAAKKRRDGYNQSHKEHACTNLVSAAQIFSKEDNE